MVSTKLDTFCCPTCKVHRAMCRRFDTIPACDGQTGRQTDRRTDGQTDGIAVANTALPMRALRAVKSAKFLFPLKGLMLIGSFVGKILYFS